MTEDDTFERLRKVSLRYVLEDTFNNFINGIGHQYDGGLDWWCHSVIKKFGAGPVPNHSWHKILELHNWTELEFITECRRIYKSYSATG